MTFYVLKALSFIGITRDLREFRPEAGLGSRAAD